MKKSILEKYTTATHKSILHEHLADIKELLSHSASQRNIVRYLKEEQNITTTQSNLSQFIKRHIKIDTTSKQSELPIKNKLDTEEKPPVKKSNNLRDALKAQPKFRI